MHALVSTGHLFQKHLSDPKLLNGNVHHMIENKCQHEQ